MRHDAIGDGDVKIGKELLGLGFVKIHGFDLFYCKSNLEQENLWGCQNRTLGLYHSI